MLWGGFRFDNLAVNHEKELVKDILSLRTAKKVAVWPLDGQVRHGEVVKLNERPLEAGFLAGTRLDDGAGVVLESITRDFIGVRHVALEVAIE